MKLYDLTQNYKNLQDLLENPEIEPQMIIDALNGVMEEINEKAENICKLIKSMESDTAGYKAEEQRLSARRKTLENKIEYLKAYLDEQMRTSGIDKIKGKVFTIALQKNAPSLDITDMTNIPKSYFIEQEPTLDKKALLKDLKEGKEIDGVGIKQTESIRIR